MERRSSLTQPRLPLQSPQMNAVPLSSRRKVIFLYYSLEVSGPAFQWALEHIFRPGLDYVTLLSVFLDEAYTIVDTKKLWKLANEEISVEVEHKKKQERIEAEMEVFRMSLEEHDIISQKVVMPEGDAKLTIIKLAQYTHAEMIIMSSLPLNVLQKTVYGSLEEYLLRKGPCTVIMAKPITGPYARRDSGFARSPSSISTSPHTTRNNSMISSDVPIKPNSNFQRANGNLTSISETTLGSSSNHYPTERNNNVNEDKPVSVQNNLNTSLSPALENVNLSASKEHSSQPETEKDNEIEVEPLPSSLSSFQQQLNAYQQRNSFSIEDDKDIWGDKDDLSSQEENFKSDSQLTHSPPLEVDSGDEYNSTNDNQKEEFNDIAFSPQSEKENKLEEENLKKDAKGSKNNSSDEYSDPTRSNSYGTPFFRPPQPQPKVKSIIESLPNHTP